MSKTTSKRSAEYRARRRAAGYTILHVHLPADVSRILAEAMEKYPQKSKTEIIADCVYVYREEGMVGPAFET